jgi:hypothetical protein
VFKNFLKKEINRNTKIACAKTMQFIDFFRKEYLKQRNIDSGIQFEAQNILKHIIF